jgi:putative Holliday junction resolvase
MGRILAIDYGRKRTGLAVSDPMRLIAGGLGTVESRQAVEFLRAYVRREPVELFVLGEPRQMNYQPSENFRRVEIFRRRLEEAVPGVPVRMVDERFTSVLAMRAMREGGLNRKQRADKARVDELSATILLQTYLEMIRQ